MRKFHTLIVLFILTCSYTNAQHFSFMNLEIDGDVFEYANKLKEKGLTRIGFEEDSTMVYLKGTFAGINNTELTLHATPISKKIYAVYVWFPEQKTYDFLKGRYDKLKNNIRDKYGYWDKSREEIDSPYEIGSGNELKGIETYKSWIETEWYIINEDIKIGSVHLSISCDKCVLLIYYDEQNKEIYYKESEILNKRNLLNKYKDL